jgi:NADP-dependent 3-hydroxy acid dehydrogenase YdfG
MANLTLKPGVTVVITGAGSGFGLELARLGAQKGLNLVLTDVQQDALDAVVAELSKAGAKVAAMKGDVSRSESVRALADLCQIDRAVLAAGAADRHRQVAALVGLERRQPAAQERLDLRQHVEHLGCCASR